MGTMPGEKGVRTSNHISKRGQEVVSTAKNRAGRGSCVQKGMIVGRKGSICPKSDSSRARNGRHIQKWGRKGFVCPKRDNIGQEMVGVSKKGAERWPYDEKGTKRNKTGQEGVGTSKNGAGKGSCVQKGMILGEKGSARPKTGQEVVRVSKKGRFQVRRGRQVQKWGRKGFMCPKGGDFGREMSGASK